MRGTFKGKAHKGCALSFGSIGLKAQSTAEVTARQLEAARRVMARYTKRGGKIWTTVFPHRPITRKAAEVPMGSGKGSPDRFVTMVKPGRILFEMDGIPEAEARIALKLASHKLPVTCKIVTKSHQ